LSNKKEELKLLVKKLVGNYPTRTFNILILRWRGLVERLYLFTLYALPLTIFYIAFGSDSHFRVPA
jgi:hypothetical protein